MSEDIQEQEPTEEQVRKLWEWCGFRRKLSASENPHYWLYPDGGALSQLPLISLTNLFEWAVPKLGIYPKIEFRYHFQSSNTWGCYLSWARDGYSGRKTMDARGPTPALALFWAIWQIIEKEDK